MSGVFDHTPMIEQLRSEYQQLATRLEEYHTIQAQMVTIEKAIKVLTGEKLGKSNGPVSSGEPGVPKMTPATDAVFSAIKAGRHTQVAVANRLNMTSSAVYQHIKKLMTMGLITPTGTQRHGTGFVKVYSAVGGNEGGNEGANGDQGETGGESDVEGLDKDEITAMDLLKVMARYPNAQDSNALAKILGRETLKMRRKLGVKLPYLKRGGLLKGNAGSYELTASGKQRVAEMLSQGE